MFTDKAYKAIGKKIKASGLQKLRWFCQMCEKQCRDENGFKCHCTSASHRKQMELFAQNPQKFVDSFSTEFLDGFMELLKTRFKNRRVRAVVIYNEFIKERGHVHMNSTKWLTLSGFVKWLGREGIAIVDETPKGWYIRYVEKDPETLAREAAAEKREAMFKTDEQVEEELLASQLKAAQEMDTKGKTVATERDTDKGPVKFGFAATSKKKAPLPAPELPAPERGEKRKREEEEEEEEQETTPKRGKQERKDYWLAKGIIVKVVNKRVGGGEYYKQKGEVVEVHDKYVAEVEMLESGDVLKLDQDHTETVLPAVGGRVLLVNGSFRGSRGVLHELDIDHFCCTVELTEGTLSGTKVTGVQYEDVCKLKT